MSGQSLGVVIERAQPADLPQVAELVHAAALAGRYPDQVLRDRLADPDRELLVATPSGRAAVPGRTTAAAVLLDYHPSVWRLTLLAPSTPAGPHSMILDWLIDQAAQAAVHLIAELDPAGHAHDDPYRRAGFTHSPCGCLPEAGLFAAGTIPGHLATGPGQPSRAPGLSFPNLALGAAYIPWPVQLTSDIARDEARPIAGC